MLGSQSVRTRSPASPFWLVESPRVDLGLERGLLLSSLFCETLRVLPLGGGSTNQMPLGIKAWTRKGGNAFFFSLFSAGQCGDGGGATFSGYFSLVSRDARSMLMGRSDPLVWGGDWWLEAGGSSPGLGEGFTGLEPLFSGSKSEGATSHGESFAGFEYVDVVPTSGGDLLVVDNDTVQPGGVPKSIKAFRALGVLFWLVRDGGFCFGPECISLLVYDMA